MLMYFVKKNFSAMYTIVSPEKKKKVYLEIYSPNTKLHFCDEMGVCKQK